MPSMIVFLIVLSVLIVVHELGHLLMARQMGIRVEKFSLGFGPQLLRRMIGQTEFCLSVLPLGGYVKLAGESPSEAKGEPWEFNSKRPLQKAAVVIAGPVMNAFLAFALFALIAYAGQPTPTTLVGRVMDAMPAKAAGMLAGDRILKVNGVSVSYWEELLAQIRKNPDKMMLDVKRGNSVIQVNLSAQTQQVNGLFGRKARIPYIGVVPSAEIVYIRHPFFQAIGVGFSRLIQMTVILVVSLGMVISGALPFKESMTGPIGIFYMTSQAAQQGFLSLLNFMGALSLSLFVLNLLPIPVLDGGHLFFLVVERIKGSPLSDRIKERLTQAGMVLLVLLMTFVIIQDLQRFTFVKKLTNLASTSVKGS